jgi:hypothetical protein
MLRDRFSGTGERAGIVTTPREIGRPSACLTQTADDDGRRLTSPLPVNILIADEEPGTGAVGYLVKGAPDDEIARAIQSAARW